MPNNVDSAVPDNVESDRLVGTAGTERAADSHSFHVSGDNAAEISTENTDENEIAHTLPPGS